MRKLIVVLVLVVVVAVVALPFAGGVIMKRTVYQAAENANSIYSNYPVGYSLEIANYHRGYSTSDFEFRINMGTLKEMCGFESIILKQHAKHGLFGVVATTTLDENPWFKTFINEKLQGQNPLHIETCYNLFGGAETTAILDGFSIDIEGEKLDVKPGEMVFLADRMFKKFKSSGTWQGMSAGEELSVGNMSAASDIEMISDFIWDGDVVFRLGNMRAGDKNGQLNLSNLKIEYLLDADKDTNIMGGNSFLTADSIQVKDQKIDDASVRLSVGGIKLDKYEEFMKVYLQMTSDIMSRVNEIDKDTEKNNEAVQREMAKFGMQMMGVYEKLLSEDLEFKVSDLKFQLPDGEVKGGMTLRLLKDMTFVQLIPMAYQPQQLMDVIYLKSDVSFPAKLAGENPKLMAPLFPGMQTGIFVKDGDNLVHSAETRDGKLFLNGEQVLMDELMARLN